MNVEGFRQDSIQISQQEHHELPVDARDGRKVEKSARGIFDGEVGHVCGDLPKDFSELKISIIPSGIQMKNVDGCSTLQKEGRGESSVVEIAKLRSQQNGWETAEHVQNFGITDQDTLVRIAKLCAQQNDWGKALYIKNFGIEDQDALDER